MSEPTGEVLCSTHPWFAWAHLFQWKFEGHSLPYPQLPCGKSNSGDHKMFGETFSNPTALDNVRHV